MDVLPFCDWMYGLDVDAFPSNVSCADIPDITCDADGYVRTLSLSERGLRGALPESFAALSRLQRLYMSGNQLTGTLPASIMASGLLIDLQVRTALCVEYVCEQAIRVFQTTMRLVKRWRTHGCPPPLPGALSLS